MLKKLYSLFPNLIVKNEKPDPTQAHIWFLIEKNKWIGIPESDLVVEQLILLKTLFDYVERDNEFVQASLMAEKWYQYLFQNGPKPHNDENDYRLIYFQWSNGKINHMDFESAIHAFYDSEVIVVWENDFKGIIVEQKTNHILMEQDFIAMFDTLKSDFFIEPHYYIGKFRKLTDSLLSLVEQERSLFEYAINSFKQDKLSHFEKVTPQHIALNLPNTLKTIIQHDILPVFKEDPELFTTIKYFLKNNMNASTTAKNLFIHRNTLQYRLEKFTEKTGIPLKEFYSGMTVYLACILFENQE
ncbi:PucR family transcriptional regulator [Neobacillus sp. D3-1R]|uniref:PucR family transcriptional regulator n=1 Tax=Neobacillus sp. D3-1R TaxID=3445778 RepID=UPI003F9F6FB2